MLKRPGRREARNAYAAVFGELYRRFGVSSYKNVPASRFADVMAWLEEERQVVGGDG